MTRILMHRRLAFSSGSLRHSCREPVSSKACGDRRTGLPQPGAGNAKAASGRLWRAIAADKAGIRMGSAVSLLRCTSCILPSVLFLLTAAGCRAALPVARPPRGTLCFPVTGHNVQGVFGAYLQAHGGVESFGYPTTEEFIQQGVVVQYFDKVRMEYHPEHPPRYRVQLGLLGEVLGRREPPIPSSSVPLIFDRSHRYYPQTGHTLAQPFLAYYDSDGGLDRFGYPLSEPYRFQGNLTQDFQRARLISRDGEMEIADWGRMFLSRSLTRPPPPPPSR